MLVKLIVSQIGETTVLAAGDFLLLSLLIDDVVILLPNVEKDFASTIPLVAFSSFYFLMDNSLFIFYNVDDI